MSGVHHFVPIVPAAAAASALFMIGSDTTSLKYSNNGSSWTVLNISPARPEAIGWNGSYYTAVGGAAARVSTDGITWTGSGTTLGFSILNFVAWSAVNSKWITGSSVSSQLVTSTDGLTWTNGANISAILSDCNGCFYDSVSGRTFAMGNKSFSGDPLGYSSDLTTWTGVGTPEGLVCDGTFSMCRAGSNLFVTGYVPSTSSSIWRSTDNGDTWTGVYVDATISDGFLRSAAMTGLMVAQFSNTDDIWYSTDATNFNGPISVSGGGAGLRGLLTRDGKIWANKRTGEIYSSTNGTTWNLEATNADPLGGDWLGFGFA